MYVHIRKGEWRVSRCHEIRSAQLLKSRAISRERSTQFGHSARYITASSLSPPPTPSDGGKFDRYGKVRGTVQRNAPTTVACACIRAASRAPLVCSIMDRWTPWPPWASARNDHYGLWLLLEIFLVISMGGRSFVIIIDYYALCSLIIPWLLSNVILWHQAAAYEIVDALSIDIRNVFVGMYTIRLRRASLPSNLPFKSFYC